MTFALLTFEPDGSLYGSAGVVKQRSRHIGRSGSLGHFGLKQGKPVAFGEAFGCGGRGVCGRSEAIPSPAIPLAGDEPLSRLQLWLQGLSQFARHNANVTKAALQGRRA
jgi:hypothetical protein